MVRHEPRLSGRLLCGSSTPDGRRRCIDREIGGGDLRSLPSFVLAQKQLKVRKHFQLLFLPDFFFEVSVLEENNETRVFSLGFLNAPKTSLIHI